MAGGRWVLRLALCAAMSGAASMAGPDLAGPDLALAQQNEFPFDGELRLDANPMPGNKRVPTMDIAGNGTIVLEMWCSRAEGQVVVAADTITVMTNPPAERQCTPARTAADADLIATLNDVTKWRRQGDIVLLIGPKTLRFRVPTN